MKIIITILSAVLLFSLSACGNSGGSSGDSTSQNQQQTDNTNKNTDNKTTSNNSNTDGSNGTSNQQDTVTPNSETDNNSQSGLDQRVGAVLNATLKYESNQPNTTVDYKFYTMTQSGKKVRLTIVPTADHLDDFKEGFIKEVVNNKDETHDVTLFQYKVDDNNNISLIDTENEKVVYTTKITDSVKLGSSNPTGAWVKTFEKKLYDTYQVTPSRYEYIGNGNWEVWVKEKDTGKYPYVTVNQNSGDFHG